MATWQTELVKELESILKGRTEADVPTQDLEFFIKQLNETEVDRWRAVGELRAMGLGFFATHLENDSFHNRADIANKEEEKDA